MQPPAAPQSFNKQSGEKMKTKKFSRGRFIICFSRERESRQWEWGEGGRINLGTVKRERLDWKQGGSIVRRGEAEDPNPHQDVDADDLEDDARALVSQP